MRATVWGCRGSLAAPGPATVRYGGNTSCVEVRLEDGTLLVLDAGTGIRPLGAGTFADGPIHLLLTHFHLDHLEGLGFFAPFWRSETELHIWGPPSPLHSLEERIARYLSPPLFPIELADSPASLTFHDVPEEPWQLGSARITAAHVSHPGPTLGYRIEERGQVLAYLPDHEPALGMELSSLSPDWVSGFPIAESASVLFHDAQFTEDEYDDRIGWGHSSVEHAVTFARLAGVEQLILFHHDPMRSDRELERLGDRARELWTATGGRAPSPRLAYDGLSFALRDQRVAGDETILLPI
jgi:ribonuclease BN (tRNA processing enzyme)